MMSNFKISALALRNAPHISHLNCLLLRSLNFHILYRFVAIHINSSYVLIISENILNRLYIGILGWNNK